MGLLKEIGRRAWGVWALAIFAVCAGTAVLLLAFVPGLERRRALARRAAGAIFTLTATPVEVTALELLPPGPCIVVANHASYVDGVLMQAVLPPRFAFVVKKEMDRVPVAGFLLRRLGTEFVARFNAREGASDTARLVRHSSGGNAMCVFPEGTFHPERGLRRFRMGAFYAATRGGLPVVPVAITGTRAMLPAGKWLPRPSVISVQVSPPIEPRGRGRDAAHALAATVREHIIDGCGEHCAAHLD